MNKISNLTLHEQEKAKKENAKIRRQKHNAKVKSDPVLHEKEKAQKREWFANYTAKKTAEEKERLREYNRIKKQESRERQKRAALMSQFKQYQQKVSTEQSSLEL